MHEFKKALKAAFPHTIPILTGFLFIGMAYGMLMDSKGYGPGWSFLFSLIVLAGSAQFVGVTFLTSAFNPLYAFFMTLMINARHLFYGLSFIEEFRAALARMLHMHHMMLETTHYRENITDARCIREMHEAPLQALNILARYPHKKDEV